MTFHMDHLHFPPGKAGEESETGMQVSCENSGYMKKKKKKTTTFALFLLELLFPDLKFLCSPLLWDDIQAYIDTYLSTQRGRLWWTYKIAAILLLIWLLYAKEEAPLLLRILLQNQRQKLIYKWRKSSVQKWVFCLFFPSSSWGKF